MQLAPQLLALASQSVDLALEGVNLARAHLVCLRGRGALLLDEALELLELGGQGAHVRLALRPVCLHLLVGIGQLHRQLLRGDGRLRLHLGKLAAVREGVGGLDTQGVKLGQQTAHTLLRLLGPLAQPRRLLVRCRLLHGSAVHFRLQRRTLAL